MIHNFAQKLKNDIGWIFSRWVAVLVCLLVFVLHTSHEAEGANAVKYKKQTVIDFEGALVEGKSRKPYSSYLTEQKDAAFSDMSQWSPDFDRLWGNSLEKAKKSL